MRTSKANLNPDTIGLVSEKVAVVIANKVIKSQRTIAASLNKWFNQYSTRGKKGIVIVAGLLVALLLVTTTFSSFYTIPELSQDYSPAHIGMPSDMPGPEISKRQLTDSLTQKK